MNSDWLASVPGPVGPRRRRPPARPRLAVRLRKHHRILTLSQGSRISGSHRPDRAAGRREAGGRTTFRAAAGRHQRGNRPVQTTRRDDARPQRRPRRSAQAVAGVAPEGVRHAAAAAGRRRQGRKPRPHGPADQVEGPRRRRRLRLPDAVARQQGVPLPLRPLPRPDRRRPRTDRALGRAASARLPIRPVQVRFLGRRRQEQAPPRRPGARPAQRHRKHLHALLRPPRRPGAGKQGQGDGPRSGGELCHPPEHPR